MKLLKSLLASILIVTSVVTFSSCSTPQTKEAIVFNSFKDTWSVAHAAYAGWCEQVVAGKVSPEKEDKVDAQWNTFRASFRLAFVASSKNWNAATPADVEQFKNELLALIRNL